MLLAPCPFEELLPLTDRLAALAVSAEGIIAGIHLHARHLDVAKASCVISWNLGTALHIEVDGRYGIELAQSISDGCHDDAPYLLLILELNLCLRRMDIDIDVGRVNLEGDEVRHLVALGNEVAEGFHHSIMESGMAHEATIDEQVLRRVLLACRLRFSHKATYLHQRCLHLNRQQLFAKLLAEDADDALQVAACRQLHQLIAIARKGEGNRRIDQGNALEVLYDVVQLRLVRLEELPSCRHIEE